MDRRGFLGRLLAGMGTVALAPALDLFHVPSVEAATASGIIVPTYQGAFSAMVTDALEMFSDGLPWPRYLLERDGRIGMGPISNQISIALDPFQTADAVDGVDFRERYLRPSMLALSVQAREASAFGVMPLPVGIYEGAIATNQTRGVSIRGLRAYQIERDQDLLRFDVVFG